MIEVVALITSIVIGTITVIGCVVTIKHLTKTMRQENIDASNKQIQVQADTNNSIRNNTEAVNRVADNVNNLLTKHEALEGRVLAIEKHNIAVDAEIKRIDNRAQQAFNRHDDRKKDIEKLEVAIAGLRA